MFVQLMENGLRGLMINAVFHVDGENKIEGVHVRTHPPHHRSRVIAKRRFRLQMIILREGTGVSFKTDISLAELSKSL